jgi:hypothetical protein
LSSRFAPDAPRERFLAGIHAMTPGAPAVRPAGGACRDRCAGARHPRGAIQLALSNPRPVAAAVALAVAWLTRSAIWTIAAGMAALWVVQWWVV